VVPIPFSLRLHASVRRRKISDPTGTLAHRIKKSNEKVRRGEVVVVLPRGTHADTLGALYATARNLSFASVLQEQGSVFDWNTAYIVSGSVIPDTTADLARGGKAFF